MVRIRSLLVNLHCTLVLLGEGFYEYRLVQVDSYCGPSCLYPQGYSVHLLIIERGFFLCGFQPVDSDATNQECLRALTWVPVLCSVPPQTLPLPQSGPKLWLERPLCNSATTSRGLGKNVSYSPVPTTQGHTEMQGEKENKTSDPTFTEVQSWGPRVSWVHSLLMNLKQEWELKCEKGKAVSLKGQLSEFSRAF